MIGRLLLGLLLAAACAGAPAAGPAPRPTASAPQPEGPIPGEARRLIVVRSAGWQESAAILSRFERGADQSFARVGAELPVRLGYGGMGWGRGLHGAGPPPGREGPLKQEGDGRSPAGVFAVRQLYGYEAAPPPGSRAPYQQLSASWRCVDDPASARYNQIFDATGVRQDWSSAEEMLQPDDLYRRLILIEHNAAPVSPGAGSCIFFHRWRAPEEPTIGCTAMDPEALDELIRFLEPEGAVLVALPEAEYAALRGAWGLP